MRIMVVADVEDKRIYDYFKKERVEGVELIVSCGDLKANYLDFLVSMVNVPMIYVRGNHDDALLKDPPPGECIEDTVFEFNGYRFLGLGGSMRYRKDSKCMFTETQMKMRAARVKPKIYMKRGIDILVTHAPAKGYGDLEDLPHHGFETFNDIIKRYRPAYMFHGHVHANYGRNIKIFQDHPVGTKIVNAYGYQILDLPDLPPIT